MAKIKTSAVFKHYYSPAQNFLLPPSLDELIDQRHLVRVVNEVVEAKNISSLINQYGGGGTSAYHPRMLLKVLLYAYCSKIYTGRKIAKALGQDIHFMWLAAMNRPDFRNRIIKVNEKLEIYKQQARQNLKSEKGIALRKQRGVEIESCFGDLKHNMGFRRFHVRGIEKVKTACGMVAMAHNLKKMYLQNLKKVA